MRTTAVALLLVALPAAAVAQIRKPALSGRVMVPVETAPAPVAAPAPTPLRTTSTPHSVTIHWGCPPGASGFDIYATPTGGAQLKLTPAPVPPQCVQDVQLGQRPLPGAPAPTSPTYFLSYTHSGLAPGSAFTYVVVALYPDGSSGPSVPTPASASLNPPPFGFVGTAAGRYAKLFWGLVPGATGYQVYRKLADQFAFQQLATLPADAQSWNEPMLLQPGQHQYYVQAVSGLPAPTVTIAIPPWPAPANFNVRASGSQADVTWDAVPLVSGYFVYRRLQGEAGFSRRQRSPVAGTLFQDTGLTLGQTSQYYVAAKDGDPSPTVSVSAGAPVYLSIVAFCGRGTLDFRWGGTIYPSSVTLMTSASPAGPFTVHEVADLSLPGFLRSGGLPLGTMVYYKLQAVYPGGTAESVVIPMNIPADPKGTYSHYTTAGAATLEWQCP